MAFEEFDLAVPDDLEVPEPFEEEPFEESDVDDEEFGEESDFPGFAASAFEEPRESVR